jgi:hypothetical protein
MTLSDRGKDVQPSSITELEPLVEEFVVKLRSIDNEVKLLSEQRKELIEEYAEKLDMKTLKSVLRVDSIMQKVEHKDTFDTLLEVVERIGT